MKKMKCCEYISRLLPWVWNFINVPAYSGWDILTLEWNTIMILHCLTRRDQTRMEIFIKVKNTRVSYKSFTCASKTIFVSYSKKSFITLSPIGMRRVEEKKDFELKWSSSFYLGLLDYQKSLSCSTNRQRRSKLWVRIYKTFFVIYEQANKLECSSLPKVCGSGKEPTIVGRCSIEVGSQVLH